MANSPRRNPNAARRSAARLAAVQALYAMDLTGIGTDQALVDTGRHREDQASDGMAEPDDRLVNFLVYGVTAETAPLDAMITDALSSDWSSDRLEAVLRAVLRAGAYEIMARAETPARVAISEYVDIAHAFYAGPEPGLVNAVLDRVARRLRPAEFVPVAPPRAD